MSATGEQILPPPELVRLVYGSRGDTLGRYEEMGRTRSRVFREACDVQPHERVLDVGCGVGRMALPLTKYLDAEGSYEGFDIVQEAIEWCSESITPRFPNFRFQHADLFNRKYNKTGKLEAKDFTFPYEDGEFDCALLWSVFTHMLPDDLEHYISELRRVLKKGGRFLATYFLLNAESLTLMSSREGAFAFPHGFGVYRTARADVKEGAVAYQEDFVRALYDKYGFAVREPIVYGRWPGRKDRPTAQDRVVAYLSDSSA